MNAAHSTRADPVLDPETVLRLAGRHVPVASAVLSVDESGGEARSYLLDDGTIFKTQRPHRVRGSTSIEKAAFFMQQLEGVDGVSVPRVLGYGREGTIEYVCESRMPGVAVRYADLDEASKRAMLGDLGRLLRRIHAVEQAPFLASDLMPGDRDRESFVARVRSGFERALSSLARDRGLWPLSPTPEGVAAAAVEPFRQMLLCEHFTRIQARPMLSSTRPAVRLPGFPTSATRISPIRPSTSGRGQGSVRDATSAGATGRNPMLTTRSLEFGAQ